MQSFCHNLMLNSGKKKLRKKNKYSNSRVVGPLFHLSCTIIKFVMQEEMLILPEHLVSLLVVMGIHIVWHIPLYVLIYMYVLFPILPVSLGYPWLPNSIFSNVYLPKWCHRLLSMALLIYWIHTQIPMDDWVDCCFNDNLAIFQLYHGKN